MIVPSLRSLRLKRFRSLPSAQLEFDNPTFLVGQNGSGKSNVVDAIAFLSDAMSLPLQTVFDRRGGIVAVRNRSSARSRLSNLGFRAELRDLNSETKSALYAVEFQVAENHGFSVVRERCVVIRRDESRDWFDRSPALGFRSSAEALEPSLVANALALPLVGGDTRFQSVYNFLAEMRAYCIQPAALRELQYPDDGIRLRRDGCNAASALREIKRRSPKDWHLARGLLESIVPGTTDVRSRDRGNKLALEFTQDWGKSKTVTFEGRNMSDGTLRTLGILAAIFQASTPSVLVIEEPAASVYPTALGAILDLLRSASRATQVIVTTHSADLLDAEWIQDNHIRIVGWERGATRVDSVSKATRNALASRLMRPGELLRANALTAEPPMPVAGPRGLSLFEEELA